MKKTFEDRTVYNPTEQEKEAFVHTKMHTIDRTVQRLSDHLMAENRHHLSRLQQMDEEAYLQASRELNGYIASDLHEGSKVAWYSFKGAFTARPREDRPHYLPNVRAIKELSTAKLEKREIPGWIHLRPRFPMDLEPVAKKPGKSFWTDLYRDIETLEASGGRWKEYPLGHPKYSSLSAEERASIPFLQAGEGTENPVGGKRGLLSRELVEYLQKTFGFTG